MSRALAVVLLVAACGGGGKRAGVPRTLLPRAPTGGEALVAMLPPGAEVVLELDVARLRDNPTLGPVLAEIGRARGERLGELGFAPVTDVDVLVAGVYRLGQRDAATLILVRGARLPAAQAAPRVALGEAIDAHTLASGPAALRAKVRREGGRLPPAFARQRDLAMVPAATGAVVRLTAILGKEARISAAGQLGVDEVPARISLWLDVADDLALLAYLSADDAAGAGREARGVLAIRDTLARWLPPWTGARLLLATLRAEPRGAVTVVRWVVGPRRLARWAREMRARVIESTPP